MYIAQRKEIEYLNDKNFLNVIETPFVTLEWVKFLKKNQNGEPVLLEIMDEDTVVAYFVGMIINKFGLKILGSPFEGWLTPDMGFVKIHDYNIIYALQAVKIFAFKNLHCLFLQVIDKKIRMSDINDCLPKMASVRILYIDNSYEQEKVIQNFTKNGRRDVRASSRKGLEFRKVSFDDTFVEKYYHQLEDVFAKQKLKPFYSIDKLYDLVNAFESIPERVLALEAYYEGKCVASLFSFGYGEWAYYMGAASYREYQKYLPNEGLFWEFMKYWNEQGVKNIDMVGYREYKMKYNPELIEIPVITFQKYPFLLRFKVFAKTIVMLFRKLKGAIKK